MEIECQVCGKPEVISELDVAAREISGVDVEICTECFLEIIND